MQQTRGSKERGNTMNYKSLPSLAAWQKDSNVIFAIRKEDIILDRIDKLLEHHWLTKDQSKFIFLCDLYFTADYWLKMFKTNTRKMEKGREPAMWALYGIVVEELCRVFGCTINGLPCELEYMWGREMTKDGVTVDVNRGQAEYLTRAEAAQYRVWFRNGKAYTLPWYNPSIAKPKLEIAESKHAYVREAQVMNSPDAINYGFFVLRMSRDLYMAKHRHSTPTVPRASIILPTSPASRCSARARC
jgi:hypothetical protein